MKCCICVSILLLYSLFLSKAVDLVDTDDYVDSAAFKKRYAGYNISELKLKETNVLVVKKWRGSGIMRLQLSFYKIKEDHHVIFVAFLATDIRYADIKIDNKSNAIIVLDKSGNTVALLPELLFVGHIVEDMINGR